MIYVIESYYLPNWIDKQTAKDFINIYISLGSGLLAVFVASLVLSLNMLNMCVARRKDIDEKKNPKEYARINKLIDVIPGEDVNIIGFGALLILIISVIMYGHIVLFQTDIPKFLLLIPQCVFIASIMILGRAFLINVNDV